MNNKNIREIYEKSNDNKKNIYKYIFGKKIYILKYKYINNQIYIYIDQKE